MSRCTAAVSRSIGAWALLVGSLVACQPTVASLTPAPTAPTAEAPTSTAAAAEPSAVPAPEVAVLEPSSASNSVAESAASEPAAAEPAAATSCAQVFSRARAELLERGFAPTRDTAHWLRVGEDSETQVVSIYLQMRQSADGPGTWYTVGVGPGPAGTSPWRTSVRSVCCDDHAAKEDNIKELSWKRRLGKRRAVVSVGYFGDLKDKEYLEERELFVSVAKRAVDQCLDGALP